MASCWRALAAETNIEFHLLAFAPDADAAHIQFDPRVLAGLSHDLLDDHRRSDCHWIADRVSNLQPDVVVLGGWLHPPYTRLVRDARLRDCAFVMGMDTPWRGTLRQHLARFKLASYLNHIDGVMVCGERSRQYARRLGFSERQVQSGTYGFDLDHFQSALPARERGDWPERFLFIGRYVPAKGINTLIQGYRQYRSHTTNPWPLSCCGLGPLREELMNCEGIEDHGFVQPDDLARVYAEHGAFIITSRFEPWGVVLVEAAGAGLPIICTEACGASIDLVQSFHNGFTIPTGDSEAASRAMLWIHHHKDELPLMGLRSQQLAAAYSSQMWVRRWKSAFESALEHRNSSKIRKA